MNHFFFGKFPGTGLIRFPSRAVVTLVLLVFAGAGYAQQPNLDSLKIVMEQATNDSVKLSLLNELAWYSKFRDLSESEAYCRQAIEQSTRAGLFRARSSAYNTLGLVMNERNDFEKGVQYFNLSLEDKKRAGDKKGIATVRNNLGVAYKHLGKPDLAEQCYAEALAQHIELGNLKGQADAYSNLGVICRDQGLYEKSDDYFAKALELRLKLNDQNGIAITYNNLSANATDQNNFSKSLDYMYRAVRIFEETGNKVALVTGYGNLARLNKELLHAEDARAYCDKAIAMGKGIGAYQNLISVYASSGDLYLLENNVTKALRAYSDGLRYTPKQGGGFHESHLHLGRGACYLQLQQNEQALAETRKAIGLAQERKQQKALARALEQLARIYLETGQAGLVKKTLDESIALCKTHRFPDVLELCYRTYAAYYRDIKQDEQRAAGYLQDAGHLEDTIYTTALAQKFAEQQIKYEAEKKETAIRLLQQQEQIGKLKIAEQELIMNRQWYLVTGLIAGLLLLLTSGFFYVSRQRLKSRLNQEALVKQTEEQERVRIAKDIHDDLGSGLSKIIFLTEVLNNPAGDSAKQQNTVHSISETARLLIENMRDLIWAMNPDMATLENLVVRIREYSADYLDEFPIDFSGTFPDEIPTHYLSNEASRNIFMIVKESLQNIVKYASASRVNVTIDLSGGFTLEITDNGTGFDPEVPAQGNGLKNLRLRSEAVGGIITIVSGSGKGTSIRFQTRFEKIVKPELPLS